MRIKLKTTYIIATIFSFLTILLLCNFLHSRYQFNNSNNIGGIIPPFLMYTNPKNVDINTVDLSEFKKITVLAQNGREYGVYDPPGNYLLGQLNQSEGREILYFSVNDYRTSAKKYIQIVGRGKAEPGFKELAFFIPINKASGKDDRTLKDIDILYNLSSFPKPIQNIYIFGDDMSKVSVLLERAGFQKTTLNSNSIISSTLHYFGELDDKKVFIINNLFYLTIITTFVLTIFYFNSLKKILKVSLYYGATVKELFYKEIILPYIIIFLTTISAFSIYGQIYLGYFTMLSTFNMIELYMLTLGIQIVILSLLFKKEVKKYV